MKALCAESLHTVYRTEQHSATVEIAVPQRTGRAGGRFIVFVTEPDEREKAANETMAFWQHGKPGMGIGRVGLPSSLGEGATYIEKQRTSSGGRDCTLVAALLLLHLELNDH